MKSSYNILLGVALGDMMGLYYEGLSKQSIDKKDDNFLYPKLLFTKGMFSDDTEHSVIVVSCLIESFNNPQKFSKLLRNNLQKWLFTFPSGVGFASLRGIIKSFFTKNSGVFSAGNAPAMRSHLIGLMYGEDNLKLQEFVKINTFITHSDIKAYYGALTVAKATYLFSINQEEKLLIFLKEMIEDREFINLIEDVFNNLDISTDEYAQKLGFTKRVSGYIYQTLPIALHIAYRDKNNFKSAIINAIECGGDSDTLAAIVGGIIGAKSPTFPKEWREAIVDYPINERLFKKISFVFNITKEKKTSHSSPYFCFLFLFFRNIFFLIVVLFSAVRRIF